MATKTARPDIGLYIGVEDGNEFFHINLHAVLLNTDGHRSVRNVSSDVRTYRHPEPKHYLGDFHVESQGNSRHYDGRVETARQLYGFDCRFRPHSVDLSKAVAMAKTLAAVDKQLAKFNKDRGQVASFGEFVTRVAEAIGAKTIVQRKPGNNGKWGYDSGDHHFHTLGEGRTVIDRLEKEWRDKAKPVEPVEPTLTVTPKAQQVLDGLAEVLDRN